jgi:hypothetical protein
MRQAAYRGTQGGQYCMVLEEHGVCQGCRIHSQVNGYKKS